MKRVLVLTTLTALLALWTITVLGAVPQFINFQGILRNNLGNPLPDGNYNLTFRIWDAAAAGNVVWVSVSTPVATSNGLFNTILLAPGSAFTTDQRWLGVTVDTVPPEPELSPRVQLASVGYSYRVGSVDGATGGEIFGDLQLHSTLTVGDLAGDVGLLEVTDGAVNTVVADGATGDLTAKGKATIGPGHTNTGAFAFVAGQNNTANGNNATVGGGIDNLAGNLAADVGATVAGGSNNTAGARLSTVGGGVSNGATDEFATVSGGANNTANGFMATIGGGSANVASGDSSTASGGAHNTASGFAATVSGGSGNSAGGAGPSDGATVGGGIMNHADDQATTIAGGRSNLAFGANSTVGGGSSNTAGPAATIAGGELNSASAPFATVGGGLQDTAIGTYSTIGGGYSNKAIGAPANTIAGGYDNMTGSDYSTVSGGFLNVADAPFATVAGGGDNKAIGLGTTAPTVGGGNGNTAMQGGTVGGGHLNLATGILSTVPGGTKNEATGDLSFAAGFRAKAVNNSAFVWGDGTNADFASTGANQFLIRAAGGAGIGTNSPNSRLQVNGAFATTVATLAAAATLDVSHSVVLCDASAGAFTVTLPSAFGIAGRQYTIKKTDATAGAVTVDGSVAETIDGAASYSLSAQNKYVVIVSDGANWVVVGNN